ncbi:hypothetical protein A3762_07625 [Oleiphilus sp. HI0125]|uniref:SprT-like domain-containing protein n=1 Tax=Oleiphilus sp. HI0125 TaxID=1822266 RepID=UPI0007C3E84F|nr:hypothetical protein A3762_10170 [Oleiphilus sp. HI0125]KZZ58526.1 hypothetical protein A3762_07625 [Oleiphilus sp. HI0125]
MNSAVPEHNLSELQQQTIDELERCLVLAQDYFGRQFCLDAVKFDLRGKAAGQFRIRKAQSRALSRKQSLIKEIRFNQELLSLYGQQFIDETVGHEVAHFIVHEVVERRVRPHGREWQSVMIDVLKKAPEVTHQYEVKPARTIKRYRYHCACPNKSHELTSIRHNRVRRENAKYVCRICKTALLPSDN